ncbi:argininosuccinate synthase [Candidatus Haliotispira prima]|uniref:Argininosuccinate synthase n=1 Tax=Candidatus Haliotispira prima TaxID=3034016 RepID=A0ABY8MIW6_9SPIO|nr:argininosuccinate synthase [Candidatus Haliotispira prima]
MSNKDKVVLAYSGGLDTSIILKWLELQGLEVIAYVADVGQEEDFAAVREKALRTGAVKVCVEDLKHEFVTDYIYPALQGNAIYEQRYLLGTSLARPVIAKRQIELARREGAAYVAHGATGKGNDQMRFELSYYALAPEIRVIAPWKNPDFLNDFKGRSDMLAFAEKHGIPVGASRKRPYSEDANLLHISHEAGLLEDPATPCPEDVYSITRSPEEAPDEATIVTITFEKGIPVRVQNHTDGSEAEGAVAILRYLNELGGRNGIGRLDMVENRFVGMKSRGVYETPGLQILLEAHKDLEGLTLDREVMQLRDSILPRFATTIYNGFWFSPEMEFMMAAIRRSQEHVSGTVQVKLYKGNAYPIARSSEYALYDEKIASMDEEGGYDHTDAEGFINLHALRLKTYYRRQV